MLKEALDLIDQANKKILNSPPSNSKERREKTYDILCGLSEIIYALEGIINEAEENRL